MTTRKELEAFYRSAEDYRRYSAEDPETLARLGRVLRQERRRFGHALLDLGCGGGALARLFEGSGRSYIGVDANPDMIREARRSARERGSTARFLRADLRRVRLDGKFDTVVLLGNALCHLTTHDLLRVLGRLRGHLRPSARFIVDYRDSVQLFFERKWGKRYVQHKGGHRLVAVTRGVDLLRGAILISAQREGKRRSTPYTQTIWSPFVLEPLMVSQGWKLIRRSPEPDWHGWRDVYRFMGARVGKSLLGRGATGPGRTARGVEGGPR